MLGRFVVRDSHKVPRCLRYVRHSPEQQLKTKIMPARTFRTKCLTVIDEVHSKGESIIITKDGKPIAKLVPLPPTRDDFYDFMKGKHEILGDIVGPVLSEDEWGTD